MPSTLTGFLERRGEESQGLPEFNLAESKALMKVVSFVGWRLVFPVLAEHVRVERLDGARLRDQGGCLDWFASENIM